MLPSWANDTVVRIRPGEKDQRGSIVPDWDHVSELTIKGCSIQPGMTALDQNGRVQAITDGYSAYFPPGSDVKAEDKIRFNGLDYKVIGEPRVWSSPTGRVSSLQAQLERWDG